MTTRSRPTSDPGNLLQDVPGAFPVQAPAEQDSVEQTTQLSLSRAVHARSAEYVRPKQVRIKVGSWNVAACKGTEKDVGGWFVEGKGVAEVLSELDVSGNGKPKGEGLPDPSTFELREDVATQEARYVRKQPTLPKNDQGSLPANDEIGLYVLGLQEIVDITSTTEALRPYTDPTTANKWKEAMASALPQGYQLVAEQQLIGLLLLVYASADLAKDVKAVSTTSVGTGLMGYMGNKGAVTARIVIGDSTRLVFINSHLAAGADKAALERRNWDMSQIVQRTKFEPIEDAMDVVQSTGEQIGDEDFAFWFGDLNYRLESIPGDDVRKLLMLHTRNEYDLSQQSAQKIDREIDTAAESVNQKMEHRMSLNSTDSSSVTSPRQSTESLSSDTDSTTPTTIADDIDTSEDPTSLQTTISSLLPHDELLQQMKQRKAFHDGWREGPVTFLPTYKYDVGSFGVFDSSEKKRAPSWCDRVLYRTRKDKVAYDAKVKEDAAAKKKDDEMKVAGTDQAGDDDDILYDYDPETDGADPNDTHDEYDQYDGSESAVVVTKEGFEDELHLENYITHQRVLSSDHKPLDAVFLLKYDAVDVELKAKVHADVAKSLDKAENEGRPNVTVVVDQHGDSQAEQHEEDGKTFEGVWYGHVRWSQSKLRSLTIANTSRVPATFCFIERPVSANQASGIAPSWLNIKLDETTLKSSASTSPSVTVEPGDTTSVELEIRILDMSLTQALNDGTKDLDEILVLRVEGGRDHFIPVRAKWLETSLGQSIDKLIRIPEGGIRKLQNQRPDSSKSQSQPDLLARVGSPKPKEPVRFSAPRELFRLTEAIEEMGTRVLAEWDMTASEHSEAAPWVHHAGWPFDEQCYTEQDLSNWQDAVSDLCNALDTDQPLQSSLPADFSGMQRLYLLSSFLLHFLRSMPDGVVPQDLWTSIDAYLTDNEKAKRKPSNEEHRTAIQEILSHSSSHSISFVLITSMLERLLQEMTSLSEEALEPPSSPTLKKVAGGTIRRMTGTFGKASATSHREQACGSWAHIFSAATCRPPLAASKKSGAAQDRRKAEILEIFLRKEEPA